MASSSPQANVDLVRGGMEDWIAGNHEAAVATFADDLEIFVPPELGNAGSYTGVEQFRNWLQAWDEAWSEWEMEIEDIEPAGDRHVIAMIHSRAVGAGSGIEVENVLAWVLEVRDGRMSFLSLQPDREHAQRLVRERESSRPGAG